MTTFIRPLYIHIRTELEYVSIIHNDLQYDNILNFVRAKFPNSKMNWDTYDLCSPSMDIMLRSINIKFDDLNNVIEA